MDDNQLRKLAQEYINKDKWWDILSRFIDVLRMNIFIIDAQNRMLLPPEEGRFGGRFFVDPALKADIHRQDGFLKRFEKQGYYLEEINQYKLHTFAVPIRFKDENVIAYMIVGPAIMNRRMATHDYTDMAKEYGVDENKLLNEISELRVVSNVMMNSILGLLSEIVRECVDKSVKEKELKALVSKGDMNLHDMESMVSEISETVRFDELLGTLLDSALSMTNSECGSIMILDDRKKELTIKVSRGVNIDRVKTSRLKLGEGIAGLAAQRNTDFILNEEQAQNNNRVRHLLKRPEIKHALVIPLTVRGKVFGVLNLHTKKEENRIDKKLDNLKYLTNLISSAF